MLWILDGRYQLDALLGVGGQGRVFLGRDLVTKGTVAIKVMDQGNSPECVARFNQEGRLAARIRDPHLVAALHFGVSEGHQFIVYDYIPGVVPLTAMFDQGRIDAARVCDVALQVLDALATLHEAGVIHQDVSPANCLWRERDSGRLEVFLADLGSAATRSPITGAPRPSREAVGTSYYMAPEMVNGEDWDHRVDLWSVGALMYALMTGCEVDIGTEDEPLEVPPPALLVPSIPQAVSDVVMGALTGAERRYLSATVMAEAIRGARQHVDQRAVDRERPRRASGVPVRAALGGMTLAALVAVLATLGAQRALGTTSAAAASAPSSAPSEPTMGSPGVPREPARDGSPPAGSPTPATAPPEAATDTAMDTPLALLDEDTTHGLPSAASLAAAAAAARKPKITWAMIERAVKRKVGDLRPCSEDEFISLGLQVSKGRVTLESVDGKPLSLKSQYHRCAHDVVSRLRFPSGELVGVVGVLLDHP